MERQDTMMGSVRNHTPDFLSTLLFIYEYFTIACTRVLIDVECLKTKIILCDLRFRPGQRQLFIQWLCPQYNSRFFLIHLREQIPPCSYFGHAIPRAEVRQCVRKPPQV